MEDTTVKTETQTPKKSILDIKKLRAQSPRSIVLVGFGRDGYELVRSLFLLNKKVRRVNRNILTQDFKQIGGFFQDLRVLRDNLWSSLQEILPLYRTIGPERWYEFVPTQTVKDVLVNRRNSFVIDPENEIIAGILVAVWILYENYSKYTVSGDFEKMGKISSLLKEVKEQTKRMLAAGEA